ncbi:MAG: alkaline phosphatase [candidate division NC10 bacterium]|nr:alkaline phosphatase [candidate division NC10 bacterium]
MSGSGWGLCEETPAYGQTGPQEEDRQSHDAHEEPGAEFTRPGAEFGWGVCWVMREHPTSPVKYGSGTAPCRVIRPPRWRPRPATNPAAYITRQTGQARNFALARRRKVTARAVGMSPDGKTHLKTILELAKDKGLATGLVTTSGITDATPAAFAAHRNDAAATIRDTLAFDEAVGVALDFQSGTPVRKRRGAGIPSAGARRKVSKVGPWPMPGEKNPLTASRRLG